MRRLIPKFFSKIVRRNSCKVRCSLVRTYRVISSASVDDLWQMIADLADVSWHPLIAKTYVPKGLIAKPGIIYQAVTRLSPIPIQIFVERVNPGELLSVRILAMPGIEERVIYQVESTLCGTRISYSVDLRGWLSPVIWSLMKPYAARVASALAQAAEQSALQGVPHSEPQPPSSNSMDFGF